MRWTCGVNLSHTGSVSSCIAMATVRVQACPPNATCSSHANRRVRLRNSIQKRGFGKQLNKIIILLLQGGLKTQNCATIFLRHNTTTNSSGLYYSRMQVEMHVWTDFLTNTQPNNLPQLPPPPHSESQHVQGKAMNLRVTGLSLFQGTISSFVFLPSNSATAKEKTLPQKKSQHAHKHTALALYHFAAPSQFLFLQFNDLSTSLTATDITEGCIAEPRNGRSTTLQIIWKKSCFWPPGLFHVDQSCRFQATRRAFKISLLFKARRTQMLVGPFFLHTSPTPPLTKCHLEAPRGRNLSCMAQ